MNREDIRKIAISTGSLEKVSGGLDDNSPYVSACQTCGKIFKSEEDKNAHISEHPDHIVACVSSAQTSAQAQLPTNKPMSI